MSSAANCLFSTGKSSCRLHSHSTLQNVICEYHLREVYGLTTQYPEFHSATQKVICGPWLSPAPDFSFDLNTVIIPTVQFVDRIYNSDIQNMQQDELVYKMNPKLDSYVNTQLSFRTDDNEPNRFRFEILRNIGLPDNSNLTLYNDTQFESFKERVVNRFCTTRNVINGRMFSRTFANNVVQDVEQNMLSTVMKLLISCMIFDHHELPNVNVGRNQVVFPEPVPFNVVYRAGIGLVTTQEILNPMLLCIAGTQTGSTLLYSTKTKRYNKVIQSMGRTTVAELPDNNLVQRSLNAASPQCLY